MGQLDYAMRKTRQKILSFQVFWEEGIFLCVGIIFPRRRLF